jgi:hypothetical protein
MWLWDERPGHVLCRHLIKHTFENNSEMLYHSFTCGWLAKVSGEVKGNQAYIVGGVLAELVPFVIVHDRPLRTSLRNVTSTKSWNATARKVGMVRSRPIRKPESLEHSN